MFFRHISTQSAQWTNLYSASQAKWASLSGIEYGLFKAELGEADVSGTYSFYNSTIVIDTLEHYVDGGSLPDFLYMVTSRGTSGEAIRDFRVLSKKSLRAIWGDVSIIEGVGNDMTISGTVTIDDSLYIGQNVTVSGGTLGSTVQTHIYRPPGKLVSPATGTNYTSGLHAREWLFNPDFNTVPYDSMIAIAAAITATSGNKINGDKRFRNTSIDLNSYEDSTLYINGKISLQGCTITGGDTTRPAVIVAKKDIIAESRSGVETTISDNVVFIADDDIYLYDATEFGLDWSALTPENRPSTFNMMYGYDYIVIDDDVVAWSSTFSTDDIRVDGSSYGIVYAPDKFTISQSGAYMEGAMFANKFIGATGPGIINRGTLNLNHYFNQDFFKTFDFGVIDNSLLEY
ncbi:MAG: hypothetical protein HQ556_04385 [Candidatus Marinimicrobia bacterium]|nr:hypothetical protein [Candidatus Neomarinimicrobiota bacterium]